MLELFIIILCVFLLGLIFYRRHRLLGEGVFMPAESVSEPISQDMPTGKMTNDISAAGPSEESPRKQDPEVLCKIGLSYLRDGLPFKAEEIFRELVSIHPENPSYLSNLALSLYSQQKLPDALETYRHAIELDSSRPGRFVSMAHVLHELGRVEEAILNVRRAIEIEAENLEYLLLLVDMCKCAGLHDQAHSAIEIILKIDPGNKDARGFYE